MKKMIMIAAVMALLAMSSVAQAIPVTPGMVLSPVPQGDYSGTILADTGAQKFVLKNNKGKVVSTGTVEELVVRDKNNPFDKSDLSFIYQVFVKTGDLGRLSLGGFSGTKVDIVDHTGHKPLGIGKAAPLVASLSSKAADGADTVGFTFIPMVYPKGTTLALVVRTNANHYQTGNINLIDGGVGTLPGFAPVPPSVPEPTSLLLLGGLAVGMGGAGLRRWRQNKAAAA